MDEHTTNTRNNPSRLRKRPLGRYRYVRLRWRIFFTLLDLFGEIFFAPGRWIRRAWKSPRQGCRLDEPRTILLIQLDHLGDAIISLPMLRILRHRFPGAKIEVPAAPWNCGWFSSLSEIDHIHVCRASRHARGGAFGWVPTVFWWGWRLRRRGIDLGLDPRGEFPNALILWLAGAKRRAGWAAGGGGFLLTDSPHFVVGRPEYESRLALLDILGIDAARPGETPYCLNCLAKENVLKRLAEAKMDGGKLWVLHVGAGTEAKRWPVEHWRELIGRMVLYGSAKIVLVGKGNDRIIARRILGPHAWPGCVDWTDSLRIDELAALIDHATGVVGTDSAPVHLAAAVGTPAVVLFSGTNRSRQWRPRGRAISIVRHRVLCSPCHRTHCPLAGHPCMRGIKPSRVWAAVRSLVEEEPVERTVSGRRGVEP